MNVDRKKALFERALAEAVDEGLLMLGESGREVVYFRLRHSYAIGREDVPSHPEIFVECLRKIFGSGAKVIEKAIIKSLCRKLELTYVEKKNFDFLEYLSEIKALLGLRAI